MMDMEKMHRKAVESLYLGKCTVYEHRKKKDEKTKLTGYEEVMVLENQPCKLSFEKVTAAASDGTSVAVSQEAKLFFSPDIAIKPGSKITVTQDGRTTDYTYSGIPAVYPSHQEIVLELFERWD